MILVYLCMDSGEQLKYALRSLEQCKGVDEVRVAGLVPRWYTGKAYHFGKKYNKVTKDQAYKLLHVVPNDPFVYMNDDFVCCLPIDFDKLPLMGANHTLLERIDSKRDNADYRAHLQHTFNHVGDVWSFEAHQPLRVDKPDLFKECLDECLKSTNGLHFKTLYGNKAGDFVQVRNFKAPKDTAYEEAKIWMDKNLFISMSEISFKGGVGQAVREKFDKPSRYEKHP